MSQDENFEIDTAQPPVTAVPTTDPAPVEAVADVEETPDTRPTWDIEYKAGDGGGVAEIHANSADEAREQFLSRYPNDKPEILSVEPG